MTWLGVLAGIAVGLVLGPLAFCAYFIIWRGFVKGKGWGPDNL